MADSNVARILVVGSGGIGGVIAGCLLERGQPVSVIARNRDVAEALRQRGPVVRENGRDRTISGPLTVLAAPPDSGAFDFVLLATPPSSAEDAARGAQHLLAPRGAMVCLQNGLVEERVARLVGSDHVIGGVVSWGASAREAGVYERTARGGFVLGTLDGSEDPRLGQLKQILEAVSPVEITTNLRGARWSKLAFNCAASSLGTVAGERLGPLLVHRFARRLALEVMSETAEVARAEGVRLEKVAGTVNLDWLALTPSERRARGSVSLAAKHGMMLAVGAKYRRIRSSMLAAIERGNTPPVDYLNGEVVEHARARGLHAPVNDAVLQTVHAIAKKQARSGLDTLRAIYERTRAAR